MHLVLTPSWYPDRDRPHNGSFFRDQARMLQRAGMRVGVLALEPVSAWQARPGLTVSREDGIVVVRGTVPTVPKGALPGDRAVARAAARRAVAAYESAVARAGEGVGRPDVVHAHSVFTGIHVGRWAADHWGAGLAVTEHRPSSTGRSPLGWRYRALRADLRRAGARASVSEPFSRVLEGYWRVGRWEVIALPVNDAVLHRPRPEGGGRHGPLTICHVSHLDENKRVPQTLRAVASLTGAARRAGLAEPRLVVVGGGEAQVAPLRELADRLGIGDRTVLTGRLPHERTVEVMAGADVFVLASGVEAGGTVLAEAQSLGLACVATPTWAGRFMIEPDTGVVLAHPAHEDRDLVPALSAALEEVWEGMRGGRFLPEQIRRRARERFSESAFVDSSRRLYERALARSRGVVP